MLIIKKGKTLGFVCSACNCEFVAGINSVKDHDGNYYCNCPMCGAECYTNYTRQEQKQKQKQKEKP